MKEGKVMERTPKYLSCMYGFFRGGYWYNIRVKVQNKEAKIYVNDYMAASLDTKLDTVGRGGVLLVNGYRRKISFKDYEISD